MVELNNSMRSQGGKNRAKNQDPDDRKFQAMIAASRRPLLRDTELTAEQTLDALRELASIRRWLYLGIVGADRRTIRHNLPDDLALKRLKLVGGAIGFIGITIFGHSLQAYYKPLKRGVKVIEDLDRVSRELIAVVLDKVGQTEITVEE